MTRENRISVGTCGGCRWWERVTTFGICHLADGNHHSELLIQIMPPGLGPGNREVSRDVVWTSVAFGCAHFEPQPARV